MEQKMVYIHTRSAYRQRGMVSTMIAIIVLLVTLLAAVALMRSVDTSNTVAGTIAFKQSVAQEAELAYREVVQNAPKFSGQPGLGESDIATIGYYASMQAIDTANGVPSGLESGSIGIALVNNPSSDKIHYTIERLCPAAGPALTVAPNQCLVPGATVTGGSTTGNQGGFSSGANAGYRLTVRVDGPKNATSYVQTILH
ncbi:pilus assembly PilX family protein [Dyella sp. 20L07]|uniref:pilus assembly PilX family protein n=1 Tax=Dyella sp. 20L07 TaxID=3384240 RepID=UPI003D2680EB